MDKYIDFGVAPYALPKVCEALWNNGVHNGFLTMEDDDIHVRWKYDVNRGREVLGVSQNTGDATDK